ncbi:hypothetical protein PVAND_002113 [Polypedilum vanderplanki]|uniref:Dynein attachment factor N-terminal domain-containing protein n=1 Tax=Polypedilum vanderplanki TaxID=319348 RepID=A0A9J6BPZ4_POLVA|nr:hypothetical protein PVAND_002113 [Polypedilum vanderplanki]
MYRITEKEIQQLSATCLSQIKSDDLYRLRNDAKLRAVNTTKSYEEFKDIVDAAHLKSLSRYDKMNSQTNKSRWNSQI